MPLGETVGNLNIWPPGFEKTWVVRCGWNLQRWRTTAGIEAGGIEAARPDRACKVPRRLDPKGVDVLPDGVMVAHSPLEARVKVRILVGQRSASEEKF